MAPGGAPEQGRCRSRARFEIDLLAGLHLDPGNFLYHPFSRSSSIRAVTSVATIARVASIERWVHRIDGSATHHSLH
jgi:hypothetical protein